MADVFISYSRKDKAEVEILCNALTDAGIQYWIDRSHVPLGKEFPAEIVRAIETSKVLVFVSSNNSKQSVWVTREIRYALDHKVLVIPFKIDGSEYNENLKIYLDIYNHYEAFPPPVDNYINEFIGKLQGILQVEQNTAPYFKRITDENDPDLRVLLTIYRSCFKAEKTVAEEFIIQNLFIPEDDHKAYLFVLKHINKIVGIADISYFPDEQRLFVSYIGVYHYKSAGDQLIYTHNIISGLIDYFKANNIPIADILFETEEERIFRYFHRMLRNRFRIDAYKICFNYLQPKMLADVDTGYTTEVPSLLVYIPLKSQNNLTIIPKEKVKDIVRFIYSRIYFNITDTSNEERAAYLDELLERTTADLPEKVPLYKN